MAVEDTIAGRMTAEMSPVFHFDGDAAERLNGGTPLTDRYGRTFDPSIHKVDETGNPQTVNVNGSPRLACKRGARRKDSTSTGQSGIGSAGSQGPGMAGSVVADPDMPPDAAAAGQAIAETIFMLAQMIGGAEFQPSVQERQQYTFAWQTYCAQRNIDYIPPEMIIIGATAGYILPRFQQETVASRFAAWKTRVGMRIRGWRAARSNRGNNGVGENHPSN